MGPGNIQHAQEESCCWYIFSVFFKLFYVSLTDISIHINTMLFVVLNYKTTPYARVITK